MRLQRFDFQEFESDVLLRKARDQVRSTAVPPAAKAPGPEEASDVVDISSPAVDVVEEEVAALPVLDEIQRKAIYDEAYEKGLEAGKREALSLQQHTQDEQLKLVQSSVSVLQSELSRIVELPRDVVRDLEEKTIVLALVMVRKVLSEHVTSEVEADVIAYVQRILPLLFQQETLMIYLSSSFDETVRKQLESCVQVLPSFSGSIVVAVDENLEEGQCRVAWREGAITRSFGGMMQAIEDIVKASLDSEDSMLQNEDVSVVSEGIDVSADVENVDPGDTTMHSDG